MTAIWRGTATLGLGLLLACATVDESALNQARAQRDLATLSLQRGETEIAIRQYRRSLELNPRDPETHFGIGEAYRRKDEHALTEEHFHKVLQLDPTFSDARLNLGVLYMTQGRWQDAIRENQILLADPTFLFPERALVNLGWAEYNSGDLESAERHFREATRQNGRSLEAHLNLGIVLYEKASVVEAATEFEEALEILKDRPPEVFAPLQAQTRFRLGQAYIKLGQRDKALEHLRVASEEGGAGEWGEQAREYLQVIE
jgi:tetratricopeptide (TPR) repeat protein